MSLQQPDAEFWLQMQQIDAAESASRRRAPNPFAAALGIGAIVLLVWTLFALGAIIGQFVSFVHGATNCAATIFNAIHCLGATSFQRSAIVALAFAAVACGFYSGRLVLRTRKAIAASVGRPRA